MTDFLSRLVDRVLGDAPVAKPLIAPHFAQGAEIFGPDAASFAVTQTESYRYGDEQAFDTISPGALLDTSSRFVEEKESPGLKRDETEPVQQPSRAQQPAKARSTPNEQKPQQLPGTEARDLSAGIEPLQSEKEVQREIAQREISQHELSQGESSQLVQKPGEVSPANEMRKDMPLPAREPSSIINTRDSARLEARSTEQQKSPTPNPGSYSDAEEKLTSSTLSDRAAENLPASLTRREGEPVSPTRAGPPIILSRATEQKPQQPSGTEARDLSESEQTPLRSTKVATMLEQQKSLPLRPDSAARQIERPSSVHPADVHPLDARATKQRTNNQYDDNQDVKSADGKRPPAQQAASLSVERVIPIPAVPVEYDSGASRIVRPERITPRVRADSPSRATTANTRPDIQTAPTIKVTIGRIEVRAVLPPEPHAQETALPAPRMSLDDYLKSVSGERR
jgi:hypothetical protein